MVVQLGAYSVRINFILLLMCQIISYRKVIFHDNYLFLLI